MWVAVKAMERLSLSNGVRLFKGEHVEGGGGACKKDAGGTLGNDID